MLYVFREGGIKIVLNVSFQACKVHSSCGIVRSMIIAGGIVDGCLLACGLWRKNVKDYCETECQPGHSRSQVSGQLTMQY